MGARSEIEYEVVRAILRDAAHLVALEHDQVVVVLVRVQIAALSGREGHVPDLHAVVLEQNVGRDRADLVVLVVESELIELLALLDIGLLDFDLGQGSLLCLEGIPMGV